jgi:preprotein translocase subunit SecD
LIAVLVLFWLGSGPVRGFAVTLTIGILASMFTAVTVTRLMVTTWLRWARPQAIPI